MAESDRQAGDEKGIIKYSVLSPMGEQQQITLTAAIVRKFFCADADDLIAMTFMGFCRSQGLDPFAKEIFLSVRKDGDTQELRPQITVAYQTFMRKAEASEHYKGFRAGTILQRKPDATIDIESEPDVVPKPLVACMGEFVPDGYTVIGGWCKVLRSDRPENPIISTVSLKDYSTGKSTWKKLEATMIRKVGIAHSFRDAFPGPLGRIYIQEEMPTQTAKVIAEAPPADSLKMLVPAELRETFDTLGWNNTQREMFVAMRKGKTTDEMMVELKKEQPIVTAEVKVVKPLAVSDAPEVTPSGTTMLEGALQPAAESTAKVGVHPLDPSDAAGLLDF